MHALVQFPVFTLIPLTGTCSCLQPQREKQKVEVLVTCTMMFSNDWKRMSSRCLSKNYRRHFRNKKTSKDDRKPLLHLELKLKILPLQKGSNAISLSRLEKP